MQSQSQDNTSEFQGRKIEYVGTAPRGSYVDDASGMLVRLDHILVATRRKLRKQIVPPSEGIPFATIRTLNRHKYGPEFVLDREEGGIRSTVLVSADLSGFYRSHDPVQVVRASSQNPLSSTLSLATVSAGCRSDQVCTFIRDELCAFIDAIPAAREFAASCTEIRLRTCSANFSISPSWFYIILLRSMGSPAYILPPGFDCIRIRPSWRLSA
jgi:hypothetical protein